MWCKPTCSVLRGVLLFVTFPGDTSTSYDPERLGYGLLFCMSMRCHVGTDAIVILMPQDSIIICHIVPRREVQGQESEEILSSSRAIKDMIEIWLARRALLHPLLFNHHYTIALIDRVHDIGRVISYMGDKIIKLHDEIWMLKEGPGPMVIAAVEQRAANLLAEVERLKADLKGGGVWGVEHSVWIYNKK
ncbi:hypothetical protein B296_00001892 [Ensete ventricosum]|uniref:Uncharacterized protein n=1 Tax=Ensete ventricosum TaxID=4639 RepID=A0A427BBT7_ENSVE|nr:hypothetical protein B296_00001892 [Ensete ventricosum]